MDKVIKKAVHYIEVEPDYAEQRIDNFLVTKLKNIPKSHIYRILRRGEVRVNKKRAKPSYRIQAGDQIRIPPLTMEDKPKPTYFPDRLMDELRERILFEDKYLLIINKPAGFPVHGGTGVSLGMIEVIRQMYPKSPQIELAHRLDADTSGCLILAKRRSILRELHELLRNGEVHKVYFALTKGHWKKSDLRVDVPLQKFHLQSGERIVKVREEGKQSLTVFNPLEIFEDATLVEATLHTGRTHQIRVHAQYRGHPIAGDEKYGDKEFNKVMRERKLKRLFLHAKSVEFVIPSLGEKISVSAPLDVELENCLRNLKK